MKQFRLLQEKSDDLPQRRAGMRILAFFVGMLLLTLLARGIAGTTTARVRLTNPGAQTFRADTENAKSYETCVPLSALHSDAGGSFLYLYSPKTSVLGVQDSAVRVDVQILDTDGAYAAVQGSLTVQDRVIESSSKPLQDGDRVRAEP